MTLRNSASLLTTGRVQERKVFLKASRNRLMQVQSFTLSEEWRSEKLFNLKVLTIQHKRFCSKWLNDRELNTLSSWENWLFFVQFSVPSGQLITCLFLAYSIIILIISFPLPATFFLYLKQLKSFPSRNKLSKRFLSLRALSSRFSPI